MLKEQMHLFEQLLRRLEGGSPGNLGDVALHRSRLISGRAAAPSVSDGTGRSPLAGRSGNACGAPDSKHAFTMHLLPIRLTGNTGLSRCP